MVTGTISPTDYLNAQRLHRRTRHRLSYGIAALLVSLGLVCVVFGQIKLAFPVIGGGVGAAVAELITWTIYLPRKCRHLYRQQKDLALPFTYTWDSKFIEASGIRGQTKRPWEIMQNTRKTNTYFSFTMQTIFSRCFPKDGLAAQPSWPSSGIWQPVLPSKLYGPLNSRWCLLLLCFASPWMSPKRHVRDSETVLAWNL
jgi:hypothetical protein